VIATSAAPGDGLGEAPRGATAAGIAVFVAFMAAGYAYNVTFVQLGVTDLGRRLVGLDDAQVAGAMAMLAIVTAAVAVAVGVWMGRAGVGRDLVRKLRIATGVVAGQTVLTVIAPLVASEGAFLAWVLLTALALGVGVPVTFSLAVDLVPVRRRGLAAAGVTAIAYAFAPLGSGDWTIEPLARTFTVGMLLGTAALALLAWRDLPLVRAWARQHERPAFGIGRYLRGGEGHLAPRVSARRRASPGPRVRADPRIQASPRARARAHARGRLLSVLALLFVVFFVDSLGFLRLVDTPFYVAETWRSATWGPRVTIAVAHVVAAFVGGTLYGALGERALLAWVLGAFVLVHLGYQFDAQLGLGDGRALGIPVLYAVAVSLYTVVTFAVWADLSTPDDIGLHAALGVAASAWTATFLATALALRWAAAGVPFERHVALVNGVALPAFLVLLVVIVWPRPRAEAAA
jgi:MFS family permease